MSGTLPDAHRRGAAPQVTGVRNDAWVRSHPPVVEQEKSAADRGKYLRPELYGLPDEMRIGRNRTSPPFEVK